MTKHIRKIGKFFYKKWSRLLDIIGDIKLFKYPMFIAYDPSKLGMDGSRIQEATEILQPGDIVLRGYDFYLDSHFIDGDYSHGSICTGKNEITHAVSPKVCTIHPIDFMECDRICILRPKDKSLAKDAVDKANGFIGTPYDFGFDTGDSEEVYCFELVSRCYDKIKFERYNIKKIFGLVKRNVYLAKSFLLNDNLEIVFEYNPRKGYDSRKGNTSNSV